MKHWLLATLLSAPLAFAGDHDHHDEHHNDDHHGHNKHEQEEHHEKHDEHKDHDSHEHEALEAHVHGTATITLIVDHHDVMLELHSPAANILGFEHEARTDAEKAAIHTADSILNDGETLFSFAGSHCHLEDVQSNVEELLPEDHDHEHEEAEHSEVEVTYAFHCDKSEKLQSMRTQLFKHFPKTEHIDVQWVTAQGQGAVEITAKEPVVLLK